MDDRVVAIIESELGATPDRIERFEEGLLHETYAIRCDGESYVLQFGAEDGEDPRDSLERGLYWYVALQDADVPVPDVVTERPGSHEGRPYALVQRLPGASAHLDVTPARTRNAGRVLARIHDATTFDRAGWIRIRDGEPTVEEFEEGSLAGRIRHAARENARTLRKHGLTAAGDAVDRLFDRAEDLPDVSDEFAPALCHDDYSPDNVLFDGEAATGVLDFDRAYAGHDQRDLAAAANAFWMHDPGADWNVRERFYEGYREVRAPGDSFERDEPPYRIETLAKTVAGCLELGIFSEYEKGFYDERIVEAVGRAESR